MLPKGRKPPEPRLRLESDITQLQLEIQKLQRENAQLRDENNKLKQSLDELVRRTKPQPATRSLQPPSSQSQASSETADSSNNRELQIKLDTAIRQLLVVQERLTINEQVTAATQRRELVQEHVYENLPEDSIYVNLRSHRTQEHVSQTTHKGFVILFQ